MDLMWKTPGLASREEFERANTEALLKFPKNPYVWYYLGKYHVNLKQEAAGRFNAPFLAVGEFLRCRENRESVPLSYIDTYIDVKHPPTRFSPPRDEKQREILRQTGWPFVRNFNGIETALTYSMARASFQLANVMSTLGHASVYNGERFGMWKGDELEPFDDDLEGKYPERYRDLQEKQAVAFERDNGTDTLKLSLTKPSDQGALVTKYGVVIIFSSGENREDRKRYEAKKAEAAAANVRIEEEHKSALRKLEAAREASFQRIVGPPMRELADFQDGLNRNRSFLEASEGAVKNLAAAVERLEKTESEAVVLEAKAALRKVEATRDAHAPGFRAAIKKCEDGLAASRPAFEKASKTYEEGPKKEHEAAVRNEQARWSASQRDAKEMIPRYEREVWLPAVEARKKAGSEFWRSFKPKLQAALD